MFNRKKIEQQMVRIERLEERVNGLLESGQGMLNCYSDVGGDNFSIVRGRVEQMPLSFSARVRYKVHVSNIVAEIVKHLKLDLVFEPGSGDSIKLQSPSKAQK